MYLLVFTGIGERRGGWGSDSVSPYVQYSTTQTPSTFEFCQKETEGISIGRLDRNRHGRIPIYVHKYMYTACIDEVLCELS